MLCGTTSLAVTPSWSYEHPKVLKGEFQIRNACMMPAEGKLSKTGMKGQEGMAKDADAWTTTLQTLVEAHLKTADVNVLSALDAGSSGASDDEIRQVVLNVQQKYDGVASLLKKRPKDIAKSRFTVGDDVALLPCAAKADVLVFVQGEGTLQTGGKKAMGLLVTGYLGNEATLVLTMADAKTGEILGFARLSNTESFGDKFIGEADKVFGKALNKQFERMRIGSYFDKQHK
jgi:hypothetical protein